MDRTGTGRYFPRSPLSVQGTEPREALAFDRQGILGPTTSYDASFSWHDSIGYKRSTVMFKEYAFVGDADDFVLVYFDA
jgi:hypothetical protein